MQVAILCTTWSVEIWGEGPQSPCGVYTPMQVQLSENNEKKYSIKHLMLVVNSL